MFDKVKALLVEELSINADEITMEAELENDLGINSLELSELVFLCEEKFSIEIDDNEANDLVTVGDVVRYIEKTVK
ncbi:MAG: acyl carrier protein [Ruminococcaceae bacterium]|nr:acyl carrier protein [Oscillospiraceae bacterium]